MNNTRRITAVALALGAFSLLPISAAHAAEPAQSCWYNVDNDTMGCFDASLDPQEQIELETGAELIAVPTGAQQRSASTAADPAVYLLGTGWDATAQAGASISYYTSNAAICNGISHGFSNLGSWNSRFESFQSYNGCEAYLYDAVAYSGIEYGPITTSADLGAFKNRAQSMIIE